MANAELIIEIAGVTAEPDKPLDSVTEVRLSTPSFAFKGQFPDVPLAPGVDYEALTAGESGKPLFVVRPLAVLNAVSDNGLKYDQNLLTEICQQVNAKKPAARQGHVSEEASSYAFPPDVGLWVGAAQVGNTLYGKAYIYPGTPFHQMIVKRKAAGSTLSNSIWGKGHFEANPDGTQRLRGLDLESIDFAPAERAALDALGGQFETTSEMTATPVVAEEVTEMGSEDFAKSVKEMTPQALHEIMTDDQRKHCAETHVRGMEPSAVYEMLPQDKRPGLHECYVKEFGQKTSAAEMTDNKQVTEMARRVSELEQASSQQKAIIAEFQQKEFDGAMDKAAAKPFASWQINKPESKAAIVSAQNNFKMYIVAEMAVMQGGQKLENVEAAAVAAWPKYEPQAALLKVALSGGNVITGAVSETGQANSYGYDPKTGQYTEEAAARARGVTAPH